MRSKTRLSAALGAASVALLALPLATCSGGSTNNGPVDTCDPLIRAANLPCDDDPEVTRAMQLLRAMSLDEKVQQMSGPTYNPNNMLNEAADAADATADVLWRARSCGRGPRLRGGNGPASGRSGCVDSS